MLFSMFIDCVVITSTGLPFCDPRKKLHIHEESHSIFPATLPSPSLPSPPPTLGNYSSTFCLSDWTILDILYRGIL